MAQKRKSSSRVNADRAGRNKKASSGSKRPPVNSVKKIRHGAYELMSSVGKKANERPLDSSLLLVIIVLVVFGLIMVFSASAPAASAYQGNPYYYITRQGIFAIMGIAAMIALSYFDYHKYAKYAFAILIIGFLLLFSVYIPGLGVVRNNARRWINIGISTLQPSEVVKVAVIVFFAFSLSNIKDRIKSFKNGLLIYIIILGAYALILLKEPHLSATLVIVAVGAIMLLVAGARIRHFAFLALAALPVLGIMIWKQPYQLERITTFFDPFADKADAGFQIVNSLYAIGSGGIFGLGLGMSRQKFLYLPEPQNDFIFAIICEELGLLGAVIVLGLFGFLIWKGYRTAQEAPDMFGTLLATGITSLVAIQVALNVAVVTSTLPATGVALPFFSYGGTSLMILLGCMGILLNISRQTMNTIRPNGYEKKKEEKK